MSEMTEESADDLVGQALQIQRRIQAMGPNPVTKEMLVLDTVSQMASMMYLREIRDLLMTKPIEEVDENTVDVTHLMSKAWRQGVEFAEGYLSSRGAIPVDQLDIHDPYRRI